MPVDALAGRLRSARTGRALFVPTRTRAVGQEILLGHLVGVIRRTSYRPYRPVGSSPGDRPRATRGGRWSGFFVNRPHSST